MTPLSRKASLLIALAAFVGVFAGSIARGALRGDFRIDEAHKLSETWHLRLLLEGRFDDPEWYANVVDRTNPPVGKYVFGVAALLAGESLPERPSLARAAGPDAYIPPTFSKELSEPYRPLLRPARVASLMATSLTAALVAWVVARRVGAAAAILAIVLDATNFLTTTHGASAVFDSLLTFFTAAAVVLALTLWRDESVRPRVAVAIGVAAGIMSALAVETRLTGAIAAGAALLLGSIKPVSRREWGIVVRFAAALAIALVIVAVAVNPYYWSKPGSGAVESRFSDAAPRPLRIAERAQQQFDDMDALLAKTRTRTSVLQGFREKSRFAFEVIGGDVQGLLLILGAFLGFALLAAGVIPGKSRAAAPVAWGALIAFAIGAWLPVAWPRYLLITVPPLAAAAATGYSELVRAVLARRRVA
ncbi:MAG: phospholipid carrier-dependent glycosyltransferase [Thermoanaerobaculia bacterium]